MPGKVFGCQLDLKVPGVTEYKEPFVDQTRREQYLGVRRCQLSELDLVTSRRADVTGNPAKNEILISFPVSPCWSYSSLPLVPPCGPILLCPTQEFEG